MLVSSTAATRPGAAMSSSGWPNCRSSSVSSSSAAPPAMPRRASCKPSALWANRCSTSKPSQKGFETALLQALNGLDPARPVYVEAESRKIGNLHVPEALIECIRHGECVTIEATLEARVAFLLKDYDYFPSQPAFLGQRLDVLRSLQSRETLARWQQLIADADWPTLVSELLELHYDPLYRRSQDYNFTGLQARAAVATDDLSPAGIARLATTIVHSRTAQIA